jgi:hypothetical protein
MTNTPAIVEETTSLVQADLKFQTNVSLEQIIKSYVFMYTESLKKMIQPFEDTGSSMFDYLFSKYRHSLLCDYEHLMPAWTAEMSKDFGLTPTFSYAHVTGNHFINSVFYMEKAFDGYGRSNVPGSIVFVKDSLAEWVKLNPLLGIPEEFEHFIEDEREYFQMPIPGAVRHQMKAILNQAMASAKEKEEELKAAYPLLHGGCYASRIKTLLDKPVLDTVSSYVTVKVMGGAKADANLVEEAIASFFGDTDLQWFQQKLEERQAEKVELDKLIAADSVN